MLRFYLSRGLFDAGGVASDCADSSGAKFDPVLGDNFQFHCSIGRDVYHHHIAPFEASILPSHELTCYLSQTVSARDICIMQTFSGDVGVGNVCVRGGGGLRRGYTLDFGYRL